MDLLANDLSVHEQFHNMADFRSALSGLMAMRAAARRFGREVQCNRSFLNAKPVPGMLMQQAIESFGQGNERRAVMTWLTKAGPFWDDLRQHGSGDWLECRDDIVTDTAVGEAAVRSIQSVDCGLVSISPSDWTFTPVEVTWRRADEGLDDRMSALGNWWSKATLEDALRDRPPAVGSWEDLRGVSMSRFDRLIFAGDCFTPLEGVPFAKSAADRFIVLLDILDRFARAFDEDGTRSAEGHKIYRDYFTGDRALFSDSSDSEKQKFRQGLTFASPAVPQSSLFCTWHGKVSQMTLRMHFSWPIEAGKPAYVVYAGPKITKR